MIIVVCLLCDKRELYFSPHGAALLAFPCLISRGRRSLPR